MSEAALVGPVRALPLAITRVDQDEGCVGALTASGRWVRLEPVRLQDVTGDAPLYAYGRWLCLELGPSRAADARPEDRWLVSVPEVAEPVTAEDRAALVRGWVDASVAAAFANGRSLGLVRPVVRRVYRKRSTGGRELVRVDFVDSSGASYDWIVPELRFDGWVRRGAGEIAAQALNAAETYFTVGLTKPNGRFPGRFGGCHPLIVGVQTIAPLPEAVRS